MLVVVGVTVTAAPLVTAIFPGEMTPVPLAKTAVRLALPPTVIDAGVAVKLVIDGSAALRPIEEELHPTKPATEKPRANARKRREVTRCMEAPVIKATKSTHTL
jgi:hypothetical protein